MPYRENCDECLQRKMADDERALAIKPRTLPPLRSMKMMLPYKDALASLGRVGLLLSILAGLGASASLWLVMGPAAGFVWMFQCLVSLFYAIETDHSKIRKSLVCAWAPAAFPILAFWRLQEWIRTGE